MQQILRGFYKCELVEELTKENLPLNNKLKYFATSQ